MLRALAAYRVTGLFDTVPLKDDRRDADGK